MAEGIDLGTAWINVVPSFKGMASAVSKEIDGTERLLATRTRSSLSAAGLSAAKGIGSAMAAVGKVGFGAVTAGVAAVGASFASLMPEVVAASDATDKFKQTLNFAGLGKSQIEALTKSTKAYADRTVYDIADIQNTTAQLAANGVQGFDKLAEAAGNLNAVAGGNKETFRSVGMVLTQTAGAGKLTTENWNQLADAIPGASGKLQEALKNAGAYTGDFRDAMAKGQITAEEFNAAIMELGLSDVAIEAAASTKTFEGAWGNLQASMVTGMTNILDKFKPAATDIMSALADQLGPAFEDLEDKIEPLAQKFENFAQKLKDGSITIEDIVNRVKAAAAGFATLWAGGTAMANIDGIFRALDPLDDIPSMLGSAKDKAQAAAKRFPSFMDGVREEIELRSMFLRDAYDELGVDIGAKLDAAREFLSGKASALSEAVVGKMVDIKDRVAGPLQGLGEKIAAPFQTLGEKVSGPLQSLGEKVSGPLQAVGEKARAAMEPLANFGSEVASRIEAGLEPVKNLGNKLSTSLSGLGERIKPALGPLGDAFSGLGDMIGGPLESGLGTIGEKIAGFFSPGKFLKFVSFGVIAAGLVAGLGAAVSSGGQEMLNQISTFAAQLPGQVQSLVSSLTSALPGFMDTGVQVITTLLESLITAAPMLISGAGQVIAQLAQGFAAALPTLIPLAVELIGTIATSLVEQLPLIIQAGLDLLLGLVQGLVQAIPQLIAMLPTIITALVNGLLQALPQIIMAGVQLITVLAQALVDSIPLIVAMLPQIIIAVVNGILTNLPQIITAGIQLIVALINGLVQALPQLITMGPQIILQLVSALASNFPQIVQGGVQAIAALVRGIGSAIPQILSTVSTIPGKILSAMGSLGSLLLDAGKSVIRGFIDGVKSMIGSVQSTFSSLTSMLPDWKGPAPVDKVILRPAGQMVIQGFQRGLESQYDSVRRSLGGFTSELNGSLSVDARYRQSQPARTQQQVLTSPVFNVTSHDARAAAREVQQELRMMMGVS